MPLTQQVKIISLTPAGVGRAVMDGWYNFASVLAGLWFHPFLTTYRLVHKTSLTAYGLNLIFTTLFIWLAQLIRHPEKIGVTNRLIIFSQAAGGVWIIFILSLVIAMLIPFKARKVLSFTYLLVIPAFWLILRSIWLNLSFSGVDFVFLTLTVFISLLEALFIYLWIRLILKQTFWLSLAGLASLITLAYLFKQLICLWW